MIKKDREYDPAKPYHQIIVDENLKDEEVQCDVCLEYEYEDDDQILICDLCLAATH